MSKRIGKRVREAAIEALLCCADSRMNGTWLLTTANLVIQNLAAHKAATAAWAACRSFVEYGHQGADCHIEAAGLLLDGWTPGEPVRLLKRRGAK